MNGEPRIGSIETTAKCANCGKALSQTYNSASGSRPNHPWYHTNTGKEEC